MPFCNNIPQIAIYNVVQLRYSIMILTNQFVFFLLWTIVGYVFTQRNSPCTLKTTFVYFEKIVCSLYPLHKTNNVFAPT